MKAEIDIPALYEEFSRIYHNPTFDIENKLINILQTAEKHKQVLDKDDKITYLKNQRIINAQRDSFLNFFDIDDVITVKADLLIPEESDIEDSQSSISSHENDKSDDNQLAGLNEEKSFESGSILDIEPSILTKSKLSVDERKKSVHARSEVTIQSGDGSKKAVYFEHDPHKSYLSGCTARVKKVFDSKGKLTGAVKIMLSEILARNEARINALLPDRRDNIFYGSLLSPTGMVKWYVFMPWFKGKQLATHYDQVAENEIKNPPLPIRLTLAKQAFSQVKFLHDQGLILGDIHCGNFIIDTEENKLHIIDLASAHSPNDYLSKKWQYAPQILPQNLINSPHEEVLQLYSQKDDIFALGITISELFCESARIIPTEFKKNQMIAFRVAEQSNSSNILINKLLFLLMEKMTHPHLYHRFTIDECIQQIDQIIQLHSLIDTYSQVIQQIAHQDGGLTAKHKLIDQQFKQTKKIFKHALSPELYYLAKKQLLQEAHSAKRQADHLRVTPVEILTAKNPCRFSWHSKDKHSQPVALNSFTHC